MTLTPTQLRELATANAEAAEHLQARARSARALDLIFAALLGKTPPPVPTGSDPIDVYTDAAIERIAELTRLREACERLDVASTLVGPAMRRAVDVDGGAGWEGAIGLHPLRRAPDLASLIVALAGRT